MREPHRLRSLQMRVAGQHDVDLALRALDQRAAQLREGRAQLERTRGQPGQEGGRDLVVAAAAGVQLPGNRPDDLERAPLGVRVHGLEGGVEREAAALELLRDLLEPLHELLGLARLENPVAAQHARVSDAAAHVLAEQRAVDVHGGREALHACVGRLREAPAPGLPGRGARIGPGLLGVGHGEPRGNRECRWAGGAARTRHTYPTRVQNLLSNLSWRSPTARLVLLVAVLLGLTRILAARAVSSLDERVEARFRGQLFAVPSRVYARPVALRTGLDVQRIRLRARLERMGYVAAVGAQPRLRPGEFAVRSGEFAIFRHPSRLPNRYTPDHLIHLRLDGSRITAVRDDKDELATSAQPQPAVIAQIHGAERPDPKLF